MDASNTAITTPKFTLAATSASLTGASMAMAVTGTGASLSTGTDGVGLKANSIVLVGKDGSFDLDAMYEVGQPSACLGAVWMPHSGPSLLGP